MSEDPFPPKPRIIKEGQHRYQKGVKDDPMCWPNTPPRKCMIECNEEQVWKLACKHWTFREIAAMFGVSDEHIRNHYLDLVHRGHEMFKAGWRDKASKMGLTDENTAIMLKGMQHYLRMTDEFSSVINFQKSLDGATEQELEAIIAQHKTNQLKEKDDDTQS